METILRDERWMNTIFRAVSEAGCLDGVKIGTAAEEQPGSLLPLKQKSSPFYETTSSCKRQDAEEDDQDDADDPFHDGMPDRSHVRDDRRVIDHRLGSRDRRPETGLRPTHDILTVHDLPEARVSPPSPLFPRYLENRTASPARPVFFLS